MRHLHQELARAQHKARIGVANAGGEGAQRTVGAGVRVGSKNHLTGFHVTLFRQAHVTDAHVVRRTGIVEVGETLFFYKLAVNINIAVRLFILGVDVVVRHNDNAFLGEDLGILTKFAMEDTDGARSTNVMGQ